MHGPLLRICQGCPFNLFSSTTFARETSIHHFDARVSGEEHMTTSLSPAWSKSDASSRYFGPRRRHISLRELCSFGPSSWHKFSFSDWAHKNCCYARPFQARSTAARGGSPLGWFRYG